MDLNTTQATIIVHEIKSGTGAYQGFLLLNKEKEKFQDGLHFRIKALQRS